VAGYDNERLAAYGGPTSLKLDVARSAESTSSFKNGDDFVRFVKVDGDQDSLAPKSSASAVSDAALVIRESIGDDLQRPGNCRTEYAAVKDRCGVFADHFVDMDTYASATANIGTVGSIIKRNWSAIRVHGDETPAPKPFPSLPGRPLKRRSQAAVV